MRFSPLRHLPSIVSKRRPIQLTLFLTRRCNSRCPFCFYLSRGKGPGERGPELGPGEIGQIASGLGSLLWLAFSGGEIFLRRDLAEIARIFYRANRPCIILLPTNGQLPGVIRETVEEILRDCPRSTVVVKLSLDGPAPLHDKLRGVPGSFARTMETYGLLGELLQKYPNFELGINTVFCAANQDAVGGVIDLVAGLDRVKTHTVSLIRGEVADGSLKEVDLERYREVAERLESDLKAKMARRYRFPGARLKAAQDILQRRLIHQTAHRQRRLVPCYAGRLNLVVTETGDLYPCESFSMKIGNVRESGYDIRKLLGSERAERIVAGIRRNGCFCTHECYFMTNILFNPALYPRLFREYAQL